MTKEEIIRRILVNDNWYNKDYTAYFFGIHQQAFGLSFGVKNSKYAMPYGLLFQNYTSPNTMEWYWDIDFQKKCREKIISDLDKGFSDFSNFFEDWKEAYNNFLLVFEEVSTENIKNLDYKKLKYLYKKLFDALIKQTSLGYVADCFLSQGEEDWFVKILKKELGSNFSEEIVSIITAPTHPSFINEYEWEIRELSVVLKSHNQKELDSKISQIIKKYFWLRTNYYNHDVLDKEYVLSEAGKMISKSDDLSFYNNNKDKKLEIINKFGLSQSFKNLVEVVEFLTYIQDKRKECVLRNNYVLFDLLKEIHSRNNDDIDITRYFTLNHEEIFDLLEEKKIDWKIVEKRYKEGFLVMYHDGIADYVYKEDIEKLKLNRIIIKDNATVDFKGAVAFKGKVVGKVRILRTINHIQDFADGDILVANQTTPEFVPAMKKAKAIITDQGGITSHAAIIARELKVPCIIGTKIATRVLKDGDEVEVNANTGLVKILKKTNES